MRRLLGPLLAFAVVLAGPSPSPVRAFVWPSAPGRIARALHGGDVSDRIAAAKQIAELDGPVADPLLRDALADRDVDVRIAAAQSAVELRSRAGAEAVLTWLTDPDSRVRMAACDVLRAAPVTSAVGALARVLGDPDASVRLAGAAALGASGVREASSALLGHLDDPAPQVRAGVADALAGIGDPAAAVPLLGKVSDPAPEVRRAVARALGELGESRATGALVLAVRDQAPQVRVEAVTALGRLRASEAVLAIGPLLEERESSEVRAAAVAALGQIGTEASIRLLVKALASDDPASEASVVRSALRSAGTVAVPPLLAALSSYVPGVAAGAALTLGIMAGERRPAMESVATDPSLSGPSHVTSMTSVGPAIVDAVRHGTVPPEPGLRALALLGDPFAIPAVLEMLSDAQRGVRRHAVLALGALLEPARRDGRAVEPLSALLRQPRLAPDERDALVRALGRTGAPRALATLIPLARAETVALRLAALDAMGMLGPAGQDATLLDALQDADANVRTRAAFALSLSAAPASANPLLMRLAEAPAQDRVAVGVALSGALSRTNDAGVVERIRELLSTVGDRERDALLEGLGRMSIPAAGALVAHVARTARDSGDRRKAAESLANHPEQIPVLLALLDDPDPAVRAHAVWSAGVAVHIAGPAVQGSGGVVREKPAGKAVGEKAVANTVRDKAVANTVGEKPEANTVREKGAAAGATIGAVAVEQGRVTIAQAAQLLDRSLSLMAAKEPDVAANAAASVALIGGVLGAARDTATSGRAVLGLCRALRDPRPYVRANALVGLNRQGLRCETASTERELLASDPSELVREAAARLIAHIPGDGSDGRALSRCAAGDHSGAVASVCREPLTSHQPPGTSPLLVFVVPDGSTKSEPQSPFALLRSDGLIRSGLADRRGALFEHRTPNGTVRLVVPGALAW